MSRGDDRRDAENRDGSRQSNDQFTQNNQSGQQRQTGAEGDGHSNRLTQIGDSDHANGESPQQASVPLIEDEEVLTDARPAWSAWTGHFLITAIIIIGGIAAGSGTFVFAVIVAAGILGYVWWQRRKLRYVVTDRRMLKIMGMTSNSTNEAWMEDIRGLQTGASLLERLLGHGHITVSTSILTSASSIPGLGLVGANGLTFGGISNYEQIAHIIRQRQNERKSGEY
jgi:hypothetical protein